MGYIGNGKNCTLLREPIMTQSYDIIGDIHGCSQSLQALLTKLGYAVVDGIYQHLDRQVIFLGDFIDRGPGQDDVLGIVRPMIESGAALSVMGNHEFNAIAYASKHPETGKYLRDHSDKNLKQHQVFLDAYVNTTGLYEDVIAWFKTLPLWLDLGNLRIVHACWDAQLINRLGQSELSDELLVSASEKGTWQYEAIETLLKGKELPLKQGMSFNDKDGNKRHQIRVRWWDQLATTYQAAFMGPDSARTHIPDDEIEGDHIVVYGHSEPPVFLGHYWFEGEPAPLAQNIACLDYSVAKSGGKLVAYRWDGEQELSKDKFIWVDRIE